jgi:acyl carrier protein
MTPSRTRTGQLTKDELTDWIAGWISRELKVDRCRIAFDQTFVHFGMDSVQAMMMVGDLEERLARRLSPTLAWDFPTVDAMADHLAHETPPAATAQETRPASAADADILSRLDELLEEEIDRLLRERLDSKER